MHQTKCRQNVDSKIYTEANKKAETKIVSAFWLCIKQIYKYRPVPPLVLMEDIIIEVCFD